MALKTYVQFFGPSALDSTKLIPACGDRSVIILDGRLTKYTMHVVAGTECAKRKYQAYQLMRGMFRSSGDSELSDIVPITEWTSYVINNVLREAQGATRYYAHQINNQSQQLS
jgi:hypothetical protein